MSPRGGTRSARANAPLPNTSVRHTFGYEIPSSRYVPLRPEATRTRLIDTAIERFAEHGPGTSFDAVAADVGVTKGALYHHFGSKDGLVEEVYKEAIRRHAGRVVEASSTGTGAPACSRWSTPARASTRSRTPFYRLLTTLHLEAGTSRRHLADIARRVQRRQRGT